MTITTVSLSLNSHGRNGKSVRSYSVSRNIKLHHRTYMIEIVLDVWKDSY